MWGSGYWSKARDEPHNYAIIMCKVDGIRTIVIGESPADFGYKKHEILHIQFVHLALGDAHHKLHYSLQCFQCFISGFEVRKRSPYTEQRFRLWKNRIGVYELGEHEPFQKVERLPVLKSEVGTLHRLNRANDPVVPPGHSKLSFGSGRFYESPVRSSYG